MVIDSTYYLTFSIAFPACLLIVLAWVGFKKSKRWIIWMGVLGPAIIFGVLQVCAIQVYVYSEPEGAQSYRVFGSHVWKLKNGEEARAEFEEIVKVTIINNSDRELVLEEVIYSLAHRDLPSGATMGDGTSIYIGPFSSESISLPHNKIDYFFEDEIPKEIEDFGARAKRKYWLHY